MMILQQKWLNNRNMKCPPRNTMVQLFTPTPTLSPSVRENVRNLSKERKKWNYATENNCVW